MKRTRTTKPVLKLAPAAMPYFRMIEASTTLSKGDVFAAQLAAVAFGIFADEPTEARLSECRAWVEALGMTPRTRGSR